MISKVKNKIEFVIPLVILLVVFVILTVSLMSIKYSKIQSLEEIEEHIILATKLSKLLHETQTERGLSIGFISSKGLKFKDDIAPQREKTDREAKELNRFIKVVNIDNPNIVNALSGAIKEIDKISIIREKIDKLNISTKDAINVYIGINETILLTIVEISKISQFPVISQNIIAYSNFLYYKENAGIERSVGTAIISNKAPKQMEIIHLNTIMVKQVIYRKMFLKYISDRSKLYSEKAYEEKHLRNIDNMRTMMLSGNILAISHLSTDFWFDNITKKINRLKEIDKHISDNILVYIKKELSSVKWNLFLFILFNIASVIIFVSMILLISHLMKSEKRLKKLIDKYIIISTTDKKGIITDASEAFCKMSEYTKKELIGKPHNIIRHPDMPSEAFATMWKTIKQGKVWNGTVKNLKKDGGYYWVEAHIEPLFDKKREIDSFIAIRLDITSKKDLEEAVEKNRQHQLHMLHQSRLAQMGEMISMIAHQWRQPLNNLSLLMNTVVLRYAKNKLSDTIINNFEKNSNIQIQGMSRTIDDFRDFFKPEKEKIDFCVNDSIIDTLSMLNPVFQQYNIFIEFDKKQKLCSNGYPHELGQALINIINNSKDALIENDIKDKSLEITLEKIDKKIVIKVRDNAGGIKDSIINKIFDPYFSTKQESNGTGLGLYMTKLIIEEHMGGYIKAQNTQNGAVFEIGINNIDG